jgi:hypothetical protein
LFRAAIIGTSPIRKAENAEMTARLGAPHGSSSQAEAVNDSTTFSGFAESTGSRLAIKNAYSHRILSD